MKKVLLLMLIVVVALSSMTGCARFGNKMDNQGGLFAKKGDYVIINSSGGIIQDVWKIKDTFVDSASGSDGWIFTDANGDSVSLGGDAKVIRVKSASTWDKYIEYHYEFETKTYQEVLNEK